MEKNKLEQLRKKTIYIPMIFVFGLILSYFMNIFIGYVLGIPFFMSACIAILDEYLICKKKKIYNLKRKFIIMFIGFVITILCLYLYSY